MSNLALRAKEDDIVLYVDPTPPDRRLPELVEAADVIAPKRAEAASLVGREDNSPLVPSPAASDLLRAGEQRVLVKTGELGTSLDDRTDVVQDPTLPVKPKDETGAGDVFLAALAVRRSEGAGWEDAVRFDKAASALTVATDGLMAARQIVRRCGSGRESELRNRTYPGWGQSGACRGTPRLGLSLVFGKRTLMSGWRLDTSGPTPTTRRDLLIGE